MERGSGILLPISSLPDVYGIGSFGKQAKAFVRFLVQAKQKYWQVLPLNPTGFGDSPYQSFSAFALNPYFIDLRHLVKKGLLKKEELPKLSRKQNQSIDYGFLYQTRYPLFRLAYQRVEGNEKTRMQRFYHKHVRWLRDYALFMALKKEHQEKAWQQWEPLYRMHDKEALQKFEETHQEEFFFWVFLQQQAFEQYTALRKYAMKRGVKIIGDMPIYVAADSADVWANPSIFYLDRDRNLKKVAGVPPDFFSTTGQLWGNPLYRFEVCKRKKFTWWRKRFKMLASLYDAVRIDHFRGFASYWAVSADAKTAEHGQWKPGPGVALFDALKKECPQLDIIAEDLGVITDDVIALKEACNFPGIKVYQFAFEDYQRSLNTPLSQYVQEEEMSCWTEKQKKEWRLTNPYLPHNYEENCVAYLGTHDNDTMVSFLKEHPEQMASMLDYLQIHRSEDIVDTLIGSLVRSQANVVILTLQDILHVDHQGRINTPGTASNNWKYRITKTMLTEGLARHIRTMSEEAGR